MTRIIVILHPGNVTCRNWRMPPHPSIEAASYNVLSILAMLAK